MKKDPSLRNHHPELFWPRTLMRKWLNISDKESDYTADSEDDEAESDTELDTQELREWPSDMAKGGAVPIDPIVALPRSRRRKSETFRTQYIKAKELKVFAGTWNVGGRLPPDDLDMEDFLDVNDPSDIYVIGFQEIIPLNAGNIFGAEDSRPVPKWENIIRTTLNKTQPTKTKFKSYSNPSSPSRFKPTEDSLDLEDVISLAIDSDNDDGIYPLNEEDDVNSQTKNLSSIDETNDKIEMKRQFSSPNKFKRLNCSRTEAPVPVLVSKLTKTLSVTERIGLSWPETPLNLLGQCVVETPNSFSSYNSFKISKSFKTYNSFKFPDNGGCKVHPEAALFELETIMAQKRRPSYVKIVSKQMVGVFLTIWVRRGLRRHIQNVNVSTVGVGAMGYIGNKGSISASMSIYQTLFCFICTHLTSGEKEEDVIKRNADVHEIHRRTHFNSHSSISRLPKSIHDHEKIIWLGDLNYRINLSYEKTRELISKMKWSKLVEGDQLQRELRKGGAFGKWSEGTLNFAPTYKYESKSSKYCGEDPKNGRRTPSWCDRILTFGNGLRLLSYKRNENKLSDHRPVTALYMIEVEEFSPRKLQKALTITDAEIEEEAFANMAIDGRFSQLNMGEFRTLCERHQPVIRTIFSETYTHQMQLDISD